MVSPLSGGLQQPFGTLYQPGGATDKAESRSSAESRKTERQPDTDSGKEVSRSEPSETSKSAPVSYGKPSNDSGNETGGRQRGTLLDVTV